MGTCLGKNLVISPAQPYTGHQKASAREEDQRTPGDERQREMKTLNHTWGISRKLAQNRQEWPRTFVTALNASGPCLR